MKMLYREDAHIVDKICLWVLYVGISLIPVGLLVGWILILMGR